MTSWLAVDWRASGRDRRSEQRRRMREADARRERLERAYLETERRWAARQN